jgi:hypothetical protein
VGRFDVSVTVTVVFERSRMALSWVTVFISRVPIYVTVSRAVIVRVQIPTTPGSGGVSSGLLIGVASGAGTVGLLLVIGILIVIRGRAAGGSEISSDFPDTVMTHSLDDNTENVVTDDSDSGDDGDDDDAALAQFADIAEMDDLEVMSEHEPVYV